MGHGHCYQVCPRQSTCIHKVGCIIGTGLNDFTVGEAKICEKQSNSKYNFMQYVFFEKKVYTVYNGSGAQPHKLGNFREFSC